MQFIDLKSQYRALQGEIDQRMRQVLEHGQYIMGPEVVELEQQLATWVGSRHCVTCASGTEALLMSLMAIGFKAGDEVITTPFTFVATAEVIALLGGVPVFVDIEADTCNIDANLIEAAISPRTRAIMPVSLYGQPADMVAINDIAARHGLVVIEDAAQSFGATYQGKRSCNLSEIGCTSFFPSKPLGCYGDGGAIFTSDDNLAKTLREIRVHGQERRYVHSRIGVGGRMDTLQCAVVLGKLGRFEWELEQRARLGAEYNSRFSGRVETVVQRADRSSVYGQYTVLVDNRNVVQERLKAADVPTAVHYPVPLHLQAAYSGICRVEGSLVTAELVARRVMSLPMSPDLSHEDQERVISAVLEAVA